ncbi:solute carrier family 2, facilitated glucose transporter member 5-like [Rhineura floridana]|uniref:solute carrier family 2, facilitated glucose transporter member 5-like n=1 Tax=Rhineura floridana TaxID=261503 RepID=UPI002AC7E998|nr:solute carrier family 2, facilitated glucose transporter member 5-like [Rhineura floridana]
MDEKDAVVNAPTKKRELSKTLLWISVGASLLSVQYGYNIWLIYSPSVLIKDFYNVSVFPVKVNPNSQLFLLATSIALFPLGGIFGALLNGCLLDRYGRKCTLMLANMFSIVSAILMGCTNVILAYEFNMFARLWTGICSGIIFSAVPIYIGELSPASLRGCIVMIGSLFFTIGVMLAQVLALREVLGNKKGWSILMCVAGIMPLCQVFLLPFFPESPRYLFIQRRDEESARQVLQRLRERDDVDDEIEELHQEYLATKAEKHMNLPRLLRKRSLRWQVITVVILLGGQQLTGINAAYYYTERIYVSTHIPADNVRFLSIASSGVLCLSAIFAMYLIDSVGRRVLLLFGFGICCVLCILLTITLEIQDTVPEMAYFSTIFVLIFLFAQCIGPNSVPSVVVLELFLQPSRASAYVIAGFMHWMMTFMTGVTFLHLERYIGSYIFLFFVPICVAIFCYILRILPETKKKTFVDIKRIMIMQSARKIQVKSPGGHDLQAAQEHSDSRGFQQLEHTMKAEHRYHGCAHSWLLASAPVRYDEEIEDIDWLKAM